MNEKSKKNIVWTKSRYHWLYINAETMTLTCVQVLPEENVPTDYYDHDL